MIVVSCSILDSYIHSAASTTKRPLLQLDALVSVRQKKYNTSYSEREHRGLFWVFYETPIKLPVKIDPAGVVDFPKTKSVF